jgi:hypothetical protein
LDHLQQQILEHQVQEEVLRLQLHLRQALAGQLVEQADQVVHIVIVMEVLLVVNLEAMAQAELH